MWRTLCCWIALTLIAAMLEAQHGGGGMAGATSLSTFETADISGSGICVFSRSNLAR